MVRTETLRTWHDSVDSVLVLSNHLTAWLIPVLERAGFLPFIDEVVVSDQTGYVKPDPRAFEDVLRRIPEGTRICYVDDKMRNVEAAVLAGMEGPR